MADVRGALGAMVLSLCMIVCAPAFAAAPQVLNTADARLYATAFDAMRRGDFAAGDEAVAGVSNPLLRGEVAFEKLFHANYASTYEELCAWLEAYSDLPTAPRVYALALRKRTDQTAEPARPAALGQPRGWSDVAETAEAPGPRAAREALNAGDLQRARDLAALNGEHWIAALAAYRQNEFDVAFHTFKRVALDPTEDPWVRAGAGYWTARSAIASGRPEQAPEFLTLAARFPNTFYGQIAIRQLGLEPEIQGAGPTPYAGSARRAAHTPAPSDVDLDALLRADPRARRISALTQVGRRSDALVQLRGALRGARTEPDVAAWTALALELGPRVTGPQGTVIDVSDYPMPVLAPEGGFTIDRALVYALVRKESRFDPSVRSSVGAYGLMQVMPGTAAEVAGDRSLASRPAPLLEPGLNLRLGQAYVNRLMAMGAIEGDVLRAVASYNAGPQPMMQTLRRMPSEADALLLIESIPVPQARAYVEEVMAAYWIYQRLLGGRTHTLDAVASGARLVPISLDYVAPPEPAPAPAVLAAAAP